MKWISVNDRLPEIEEEVLAWNGECIEKAHRESIDKIINDKEWYWTYYDYLEWHNVTHWMPLPQPPKIQESENSDILADS